MTQKQRGKWVTYPLVDTKTAADKLREAQEESTRISAFRLLRSALANQTRARLRVVEVTPKPRKF